MQFLPFLATYILVVSGYECFFTAILEKEDCRTGSVRWFPAHGDPTMLLEGGVLLNSMNLILGYC